MLVPKHAPRVRKTWERKERKQDNMVLLLQENKVAVILEDIGPVVSEVSLAHFSFF